MTTRTIHVTMNVSLEGMGPIDVERIRDRIEDAYTFEVTCVECQHETEHRGDPVFDRTALETMATAEHTAPASLLARLLDLQESV
jgi:hypothetical protein